MAAPSKTRKSTSAKKTKKTVPSTEFALQVPEAGEVFLVGDFNDWNADGYKMRKFKDGTCKKKVKLKPGRYEYRFIVDGDWWTDPQNDQRCSNPFGQENSVITIEN